MHFVLFVHSTKIVFDNGCCTWINRLSPRKGGNSIVVIYRQPGAVAPLIVVH